MDIVYLHELRADATIGVWDWERRIRQTLIFDLELGTDTRAAGASDDLRDTIDYKAVADLVSGIAGTTEYQLIEALGEHIARDLLNDFNVTWLRLKITKQGVVRGVRDVGIVIERGTRP